MNANAGHRSNRRAIIAVAAVAILLMVLVCATLSISHRPPITAAEFQKVRIGLSRTDLHKLLGNPDHQQLVLGKVESPTSMVVNFSDGEYKKRLLKSGYNDYILETWFSPSITIMAYVDQNDQVVCRMSSAGQKTPLLARMWPRRRVSLVLSK